MRYIVLLLCFVLISNPVTVAAQIVVSNMPELYFRTVKTKGDDFIFLTAQGDVQLEDYWLGYDSSLPVVDLVPEYQMPSGVLQNGQTILLTSQSAVPTCDAVLSSEIPVALADTKGSVALWKQGRSSDNKTISYTFQDSFTWSTSSKTIADLMFTDTAIASPVGHRLISDSGASWETGLLTETENGNCVVCEKSGQIVENLPFRVVEDIGFLEVPEQTGETAVADTNEEQNLASPIITELLPNPVGTGNDETDEYIELYNPNNVAFDLSGYVLQTCMTTFYTYTFPEGVMLAPKSYEVFSAEQTNLTLSNTKGQVILKNKSNHIISQTDPYASSVDGRVWVLKDGTWSWSTTATPSADNIVTEPVAINVTTAKKAVKSATTTAKKVTTVKKVAKKSPKSAKKSSTTTGAAKKVVQSTAFAETSPPIRSIHPLVLALVVLAAVGYGLYEYRHDVANRFHKFRTNRATRRANRG